MFLYSHIEIEITSASVYDFLSAANNEKINFEQVKYINELLVRAVILRDDWKLVLDLAKKRGDRVKLIKQIGIYYGFRKIFKRPVLVIGFLFWLFLVLFLPTKVLFIEVQGNAAISTEHIIEKAASLGVSFGKTRRAIRSEKVKNGLLSEIPELQWVGVNTNGCVAVITVKERENNLHSEKNNKIANIIASHDGVICGITVTSGNVLCKVGQAVKKDQVLVSGYTDCGLHIKAERADAEVTALTMRKISSITPLPSIVRTKKISTKHNYSVQIGKNFIKLYKDSRICDASYDKMYTQWTLTLPGGFQLPIKIIKETVSESVLQHTSTNMSADYDWMFERIEDYLLGQMLGGQIDKSNVSLEKLENSYRLDGIYFCKEIIGKIRYEEILNTNG